MAQSREGEGRGLAGALSSSLLLDSQAQYRGLFRRIVGDTEDTYKASTVACLELTYIPGRWSC